MGDMEAWLCIPAKEAGILQSPVKACNTRGDRRACSQVNRI
jgi:hypothetical protein